MPETARRYEPEPVPPYVRKALDDVAAWLERDAVSYDRASDAEAAADKREHAMAIRKLAEGNGSDDLRTQAIEFLRVSKVAGWENAIAALEGMHLPE